MVVNRRVIQNFAHRRECCIANHSIHRLFGSGSSGLGYLGGVPDQAVDDTRISTVWTVERSTWHANSLRQHTH